MWPDGEFFGRAKSSGVYEVYLTVNPSRSILWVSYEDLASLDTGVKAISLSQGEGYAARKITKALAHPLITRLLED